MTADMIRQLPDGHALVLRGSLSPVIARLAVAWKDRAYKAARRAGTAVAHLPAAPGLTATGTPSAARRRLAAVPDLDPEAGGDTPGGDAPAYPWS